MIAAYLVSEEIDRLEGAFAVLANKVVEYDAAIRENLFNSKRALFAAASGHNLGFECNVHLGSSPNL